MKHVFLMLLLASAMQARAKTIQAQWPLMSYAEFMQMHADAAVKQSPGARGFAFPGMLVFDPGGALVWAGEGEALMQQPASVLSGRPTGSARLGMVLDAFVDSSTGQRLDTTRPTLVIVVLGGEMASNCTKCSTAFIDLAPQLAEDGRAWNIVEATVSTKSTGG